MYKWVWYYIKTCETCQRVKPSPVAAAPLMSLPVPSDCWRTVSMDFILELPPDGQGHTGILVFVCRLSKMVRLVEVKKSVTAPQAAQLFVDHVFRHHGLPEAFVSDRDPRFVSHFRQHLFRLLGTKLDMSTADHPQTDGQTERVNRVLEDVLRSFCVAEPTKWSTQLAQVKFALNNAMHASTVSRHSTSTACGIRVRRCRCPRHLSWVKEELSKTTQESSQACVRPSNGTSSRSSRRGRRSALASATL
jgi:hypothetical protein